MRVDGSLKALIELALREDLGSRGDVTTKHFLPKTARLKGRLVFKEAGVLCGREVFDAVLRRVCPAARTAWRFKDGARVPKGAVACRIAGPRGLLTAERTALNFLQKLCGIATLARAYARAARKAGGRTLVYDTRKTLPGWRALSKYAVRAGGGKNHRMGLYDMAMLKDNHLEGRDPEEIVRAVRAFRKRHPRVPVEMEATGRAQTDLALRAGADVLLLDNMSVSRLKREIARIRRFSAKTEIEISGGVALKDIPRLCRLGADRISVGRLTHSAPALDISLALEAA